VSGPPPRERAGPSEGHLLGNHTWSHSDLRTRAEAQIRDADHRITDLRGFLRNTQISGGSRARSPSPPA